MTRRVLVAGVGNVFLGDDGFGPEVVRLLHRLTAPDRAAAVPDAAAPDGAPVPDRAAMPDGVKVVDFGIRGVHLAYELLDGYDLLVLVDTVRRGDPPGTVSTIEVDLSEAPEMPAAAGMVDGHGLEPDAVLALLRTLGGDLPAVTVIGCEAAELAEGMGLSEVVAAAVEPAARAVLDLIGETTRKEGVR
ncbi:MAG: hydrogenase maturation protease [Micromonosporaceae bacterium]